MLCCDWFKYTTIPQSFATAKNRSSSPTKVRHIGWQLADAREYLLTSMASTVSRRIYIYTSVVNMMSAVNTWENLVRFGVPKSLSQWNRSARYSVGSMFLNSWKSFSVSWDASSVTLNCSSELWESLTWLDSISGSHLFRYNLNTSHYNTPLLIWLIYECNHKYRKHEINAT